jgi:hypothetical protein
MLRYAWFSGDKPGTSRWEGFDSLYFGGGNPDWYPPGNLFPSIDEFRRQFMNFAGNDFRLVANSPWMKGGSDGRPIGADFHAITRVPPGRR